MRRLAATAALLLGTGCATGYHPRSGTGGFSETQLDENVFQMRFNGNDTYDQRAAD